MFEVLQLLVIAGWIRAFIIVTCIFRTVLYIPLLSYNSDLYNFDWDIVEKIKNELNYTSGCKIVVSLRDFIE